MSLNNQLKDEKYNPRFKDYAVSLLEYIRCPPKMDNIYDQRLVQRKSLVRTVEKIIAGVILLGLTSCAPIYIPEGGVLRYIENIPPDKRTMNCCDKSVLYHKYLRSKGYKSRVVSGHRTSAPKGKNHAWVEVLNPKTNEWHMMDPTFPGSEIDREGFEIKYYPERERWYIYFDDVTKEDIINRKIKKDLKK